MFGRHRTRDRAVRFPALSRGLERNHFRLGATGTHTERWDVDLVVTGQAPPLRAESIAGELESIAAELDDLPLPYKFEVQPLEHIQHALLREHIQRVDIVIYSAI